MYYEYFGLTQAPFRITPNTEFFFGGGNRGPILEALIYAVTHGEGIIKVSGEVGSGKTMLCNMLMERVPENVETVYIANPSVSPEEILRTIAFELQLPLDRAASRLEVMQAVQDYLLARHATGKRVVVFVEESQGMPSATLEEIRLLSNLETRNDKLLQIVLFGQPELDENLRQPNIRQLRERITHSFGLAPLNTNDVREYLMFRLRAAGYHGPDLFAERIVKMITRASGGLTRRVNLIADKALLAAFSENTHTIKPRHIEAALRDSEFSHVSVSTAAARRYGWVAAALVGGALGAAGYAWLMREAAPVASPQQPSAQVMPTSPARVAPDAPDAPITPITPPTPADAPLGSPQVTQLPVPGPVSAEQPSSVTPAPQAGAPTAVGAKADQDILRERLDASILWLAKRQDTDWTLQTLSTTSENDLRNHLRYIEKTVEITKIFVYRHSQNGESRVAGVSALGPSSQQQSTAAPLTMYSVIFGSYGSRVEAERSLTDLPAQLKSNKPLPVMVQQIRARLRDG